MFRKKFVKFISRKNFSNICGYVREELLVCNQPQSYSRLIQKDAQPSNLIIECQICLSSDCYEMHFIRHPDRRVYRFKCSNTLKCTFRDA